MSKRLFSFIFSVLCMLASASVQAQGKPLRIGFQTGDINVLLMYASQTGQFAKQGIELKMTPFPAGPAMLPALAAGEID
ncbi:MAG: hypothetical protein ACK5O3_10390, partial [Burkholderiales bacterium]